MDKITIDIPEGLPADQREELVGWLNKEAAAALPKREAFEDDPAWLEETARRIKASAEQADAGQFLTATDCRRHLDAKLGIKRGL
jgi:hypothetical protein